MEDKKRIWVKALELGKNMVVLILVAVFGLVTLLTGHQSYASFFEIPGSRGSWHTSIGLTAIQFGSYNLVVSLLAPVFAGLLASTFFHEKYRQKRLSIIVCSLLFFIAILFVEMHFSNGFKGKA
jgi:hypothetical protein